MRLKNSFVGILATLTLGIAPCAMAQNAPDPAPQSSPLSAFLRDVKEVPLSESLPGWIKIGGQIRGRFEAPSGSSLANGNSADYYASRIRVNLLISPFPWLDFFAEGQDARIGGEGVSSPAPTTLYNPMDLRQAYVTLRRKGLLQVRVGRQELAFGAERLIGPADWGMSRTFDAFDVKLSHHGSTLDMFGGSAVTINNSGFDWQKPGEHFYGAYGSIAHLIPGMTVEPYVLFKENLDIKSETGVLGNAMVTSPGLRMAGKTPGRFDYSVEGIMQRGYYSSDRVEAFAHTSTVGWTMSNSSLKPRISAEYSYASGDAAQKDGIRGTFDQFYPSNHGYYGMIDQFGWKNLKNSRVGFDFTPLRKLKVRVDYNDFHLATVADGLYASSGSVSVLNRNATSDHIGNEINATALYQLNRVWKCGAGFGHLWAGDYLKESKANFGYTYPYVMFSATF